MTGLNASRAQILNLKTAAALSAVALFAFAGAARAQAPADWTAIESAAKKEGKVVLYTSSAAEDVPLVMKKFQDRYGIETSFLRGRGSELRERLRTEHASNRQVGDVVSSGNTLMSFEPAIFDRHPVLPNATKLVTPFKDDGLFVPSSVALFTILVNTNLVKPEDEPKSWKDLLDPKWKGKLLVDDPRATGQGNVSFMVLAEKFGPDFLTGMARQGPVFTRDRSVSARRVAQGEYPIYFVFGPGEFAALEGLPLKIVIPQEGAPYTSNILAKIAGAPHPNAALLLINFMLGDEAQNVFADLVRISVTGKVSGKLSPMLQDIAKTRLLGEADPAKVDEMLAVFTSTFK